MMATGVKRAFDFILSPGNCHDAPYGRILMARTGNRNNIKDLVMDRGYEDNYTRYTAQIEGFNPITPPKSNRKNPQKHDKELYEKRNEIECLFRLIQDFRRVFCRFDKLDDVYIGFIQIALIFIAIR